MSVNSLDLRNGLFTANFSESRHQCDNFITLTGFWPASLFRDSSPATRHPKNQNPTRCAHGKARKVGLTERTSLHRQGESF
jgi:hypothetical protein